MRFIRCYLDNTERGVSRGAKDRKPIEQLQFYYCLETNAIWGKGIINGHDGVSIVPNLSAFENGLWVVRLFDGLYDEIDYETLKKRFLQTEEVDKVFKKKKTKKKKKVNHSS